MSEPGCRITRVHGDYPALVMPFIELCERAVASALRRLGDDWAAGDVTIAVEHRASAICERLLAALRHENRHHGCPG